MVRNEMLDVRFFPEMKMGRERMLKKVDDKIPNKHQEIREFTCERHRLRQYFQERGGQHESRAERQKIFQILARPFTIEDKEPAQNIGCRSREPKQQR